MAEPANDVPFTAEFVLRETLRHMERPINYSMQKTIARLQTFTGNPEKTREALAALASLNRLRRLLSDIKENNKEIFDA